MKVYDYISKLLTNNGCKRAFGVPGSYIMPMWQNINIPITLCTHESDASYIASTYAKKAKELTLVLVTSSPGVTNCISGIASAYRDSNPLIIISGTTPTSLRKKGAFQEESAYDRSFFSTDITKSIVKKNYIIEDAKSVNKIIKDAIKLALSDRKGPVHISIPIDIQNEDINEDDYVYESQLDNNIPNYNFNFSNPLIIVGNGCNDSKVVDLIYKFSNHISSPIICSMKGMSYISDNKYVIGSVGMGSLKTTIDFVNNYNPQNIFCFGTSLSNKDFANVSSIFENSNIYIFSLEDTYKEKFNNYYHFQTNNLSIVIDYLINNSNKIESNISDEIKELKDKIKKELSLKISKSGIMSKSIKYIMDIVNDNTIITTDAGNHYLDAISCFRARDFESFSIDAGLAAMGNGICGTVGLSIASPNRKCICITGDGCALMNGTSIYTAKTLNLPIIFVVINNSSLGRVRVGQSESKKYISSDINNVNFKNFGEAFNVKSYSVNKFEEFKNVFDKAINENETILIEILCDKDEKPIVFI